MERQLRKDIREIKSSLTYINQSYEEIKTSVETVEKENEELRKYVTHLQEERDALRSQLKDHEIRLGHYELHCRCFNIEVWTVPLTEHESVLEISKELGVAIVVPLENAHIEARHRVRTARNTAVPYIVVQFAHRGKRDAFLEKAKKQNLTSEKVRPDAKDSHLCK